MSEIIKEQLDKEISSELDVLDGLEVGSETYKITVDCVSKLIDKRNDMEKIDLEKRKQELNEQIEKRKQELNEQIEQNKNCKEKELNEYNKKDRLINHAISIGSIVIPIFVTIWGTYKTFEFEKTGTVTTIMGRGFINKLIPKK